jgi:hypothetical protein
MRLPAGGNTSMAFKRTWHRAARRAGRVQIGDAVRTYATVQRTPTVRSARPVRPRSAATSPAQSRTARLPNEIDAANARRAIRRTLELVEHEDPTVRSRTPASPVIRLQQLVGNGSILSLLQALNNVDARITFSQALESARGGGEPLPRQLRAEMEQRLGADLASVRGHRGLRAGRLTAARQAVTRQAPGRLLQRACACGKHEGNGGECEGCQEERPDTLQRSTVGADLAGAEAPPIVHDVLRSSGKPLDEATRAHMEPRFGHDFSHVRIHTDSRAAESVRAVNAQAWTVGNHIAFGTAPYCPATTDGAQILAHELAHTIQQRGTSTNHLVIGTSDDVHEREASRVADTIETARTGEILSPVNEPRVMRTHLFTSTISMKHRLLRSRTFRVAKGGVVVSASAVYQRLGTPECSVGEYHMTLMKAEWFDDSYGTCVFPQGRPVRHEWAGLPDGDYYLDIWTNNTNPYCDLVGDIVVEEQAGLREPSCTVQPPGPLDTLQSALEIAGFVPVLGPFADAVNAGIYGIRGDWVNAGISAVSIIPVFGDAASVARIGARTAVKIEGSAISLLGKDAIAAGLKDAKATRRAVTEAAEDVAGRSGRRVDPEIDDMVTRGIREEATVTTRPVPRPRPQAPPAREAASAARSSFDTVRPEYARRLGVGPGGQVHHAIELQVLDRYPGALRALDLNDFSNMRGIATERVGRRQLHNSKIREIWDRHYRAMDAEIAQRGLRRGTEEYNDFVRTYLHNGRDEIDYVLGQFFTEYRKGLTWTRKNAP